MTNGSSGEWEVAIDESTSGPDRWFAQIEGPSISFYFEIPPVEIVGELLGFLESPPVVDVLNLTDALRQVKDDLSDKD